MRIPDWALGAAALGLEVALVVGCGTPMIEAGRICRAWNLACWEASGWAALFVVGQLGWLALLLAEDRAVAEYKRLDRRLRDLTRDLDPLRAMKPGEPW